ncbi:hypothetical protein NPIL_150531 [Nephila pilipes]|uniref:Uncharacterized protein n=1 Tax=Nephila pilipes TaxID=299642 RepID=A0A8X6MZC4_NEPPI|nr:hypothetical protein NPIL_150531 [Nephila pilipes]
MLFRAGGKTEKSVLVQYKKRFGNVENIHFLAIAILLYARFKIHYLQDHALLGTWIKKLNKEIKEGGSLDSNDGQFSPAPSSSRGK